MLEDTLKPKLNVSLNDWYAVMLPEIEGAIKAGYRKIQQRNKKNKIINKLRETNNTTSHEVLNVISDE